MFFTDDSGAHFDEPAVFEDFVSNKKFYACPRCLAVLGEMVTPSPEAALPKVAAPAAEAPWPKPAKSPEQAILLEVVVKGPAVARVVQTEAAPS